MKRNGWSAEPKAAPVTIGRRSAVSSLAFSLFGFPALLAAQWDRLPSVRPNPRLPPQSIAPELIPTPKERMRENLKNLRHEVDQLFQMTQDLKTEADKTNQADLLSLNFVHKADEIESWRDRLSGWRARIRRSRLPTRP